MLIKMMKYLHCLEICSSQVSFSPILLSLSINYKLFPVYIFLLLLHTMNFFLGGCGIHIHLKLSAITEDKDSRDQWILLNISSVVFDETHNDPDLYFVFCENNLLCPYHIKTVSVKVYN